LAPATGGAPAPAGSLTLVSGNGQTGTAGQPLANPFVVKVADGSGNPVTGATVNFAVTGGGGGLSSTLVTTNRLGMASTTLTLGPNAGANTVSASSGTLSGSPLTFSATGSAAAPSILSSCDLNRDGTVDAADVQILVQQSLGTLGCVADLNRDGICNVLDVQRLINVTLGGACPTGSAPTGSAPPANLVLVSGSGQTGPAGQALANPFVVKVTDASGNPVVGVTVTFAVTAGGGALSSGSATTNSSGTASATLTLGPSAGTNTVTASLGSLSGSTITFSATSSASTGSTNVTSPGSTNVTWTVQPRTSPWPAFIGWATALYDPVSRQTLWYLSPANYFGIYSTHMFFYDSATGIFTDIGGTASTVNACPPDTATVPGERHPDGQMGVRPKRSL